MDSRTCSANLLARLGPSIYQPADQPATSTSPIVLTTSPQPLLRGGSMADSGEQAPAHRHRTIYPAHPGDGVLPILLAAHAYPNARVSHPTDELQTNSLALARTEGPTRGVIVRYCRLLYLQLINASVCYLSNFSTSMYSYCSYFTKFLKKRNFKTQGPQK